MLINTLLAPRLCDTAATESASVSEARAIGKFPIRFVPYSMFRLRFSVINIYLTLHVPYPFLFGVHSQNGDGFLPVDYIPYSLCAHRAVLLLGNSER